MKHRKLAVRAAALLLTILVVLSLLDESRSRDFYSVFVLDQAQARALCEGSGYPEGDFLERARTMGVAGMLLRPGAAPQASEAALPRDSARSAAPQASEAALPRDSARSAASQFDPDLARGLAARGFVVVPHIEDGLQLITFKDLRLRAVYLIAASYRNPLKRHIEALREALDDGRSWVAFPNAASHPGGGARGIGSMAPGPRAAFSDGAGGPAGTPMTAGEMAAADGVAAARREVLGRGNRLVVLRLDPRRDIEENLSDVRRIVRRMRDDGLSVELPSPVRGRVPRPLEGAARRVLAMVLCVLGPIFALRCGVQILHAERESPRWPVASPFREVLLAALAMAGAAALVGLAAYAASARAAWRSAAGPWPGGAAASATLILSALGLYLPEAGPGRSRPGAWLSAAPAFAWTLAALALLHLGGGWEGLGIAARLKSFSAARPDLWWVADRWREWLLGYPCLFTGLCLLHSRLETEDGLGGGGPGDPRPWLLLAMFAPMGTVGALASGRTPSGTALSQAGAGGLVGLAIGGLLYGAVCFAPRLMPALAGLGRKR